MGMRRGQAGWVCAAVDGREAAGAKRCSDGHTGRSETGYLRPIATACSALGPRRAESQPHVWSLCSMDHRGN